MRERERERETPFAFQSRNVSPDFLRDRFRKKLEGFEIFFVQSVVCIAMSSPAGNVH
jgi:hypothetical protein